MIDTAFLHHRNVSNVGDLACSPGHYFDLGKAAFFDLKDEAPACTRAVIGGGQIFNQAAQAVVYGTAEAKHRIIWAIALAPRDKRSLSFDLLEANCALVSTRNWGVDGVEYVPCASAMSHLLDTPKPPRHDVVLFSHSRKSTDLLRVDGIPEWDNHRGDMADVIDFLASGETVVTNSYHGTYWALCLGRRVLCLPFSNKFQFFKAPPVMADPTSWTEMLDKAERREDVLAEARQRNIQFYEKVRNLT